MDNTNVGYGLVCNRRELLDTGWRFALGVAAIAIGGCSLDKQSQPNPPYTGTQVPPSGSETTVFVRDWEQNSDAEGLNRLPVGSVNVDIAFAVPNESSDIESPTLNPALIGAIGRVATNRLVEISIGGWGGTSDQHNQMLSNFENAAQNPTIFAAKVQRELTAWEGQYNMRIGGINLDWEFPAVQDGSKLVALVKALKAAMPNRRLTMAVPAMLREGYVFGNGGLQEYVDRFMVMAYDYTTPSSPAAGNIAPGAWVIDSVSQWVRVVGDASKVVVGFPAYGYEFIGAKAEGDTFDPSSSDVPYSLIAQHNPSDDRQSLTSHAIIDGNWTSASSPAIIEQVYKDIKAKYPKIGGAFFWYAAGILPSHLSAVTV